MFFGAVQRAGHAVEVLVGLHCRSGGQARAGESGGAFTVVPHSDPPCVDRRVAPTGCAFGVSVDHERAHAATEAGCGQVWRPLHGPILDLGRYFGAHVDGLIHEDAGLVLTDPPTPQCDRGGGEPVCEALCQDDEPVSGSGGEP